MGDQSTSSVSRNVPAGAPPVTDGWRLLSSLASNFEELEAQIKELVWMFRAYRGSDVARSHQYTRTSAKVPARRLVRGLAAPAPRRLLGLRHPPTGRLGAYLFLPDGSALFSGRGD